MSASEFMAGLLASRLAVDVARRISFRRIAGLIFYLAGAVIATLTQRRWSLARVALPVGALIFLVVFDSIRPMIVIERPAASISRPRVL